MGIAEATHPATRYNSDKNSTIISSDERILGNRVQSTNDAHLVTSVYAPSTYPANRNCSTDLDHQRGPPPLSPCTRGVHVRRVQSVASVDVRAVQSARSSTPAFPRATFCTQTFRPRSSSATHCRFRF
ncbi:hypothetical protein F441_13077 [Phytophthora nicotianae CJ01A1]|uniref:Uncharacterized protein n=2 Tax=Phytophthora nicotianae TaxID=4792 RepID=W2JDR2_PHYNI|nr:hypothetical protein L915_05780 [Phytophthora nicotianae]ETL43872.1 hypothetical protein L916_05716 [Phytophthora nicotianae]ETP11407.1 hypothetical protein F441_13077 [Phytophthora nicotianae CJ01A1]